MKALEVCRRLFLLGKQKMCFLPYPLNMFKLVDFN